MRLSADGVALISSFEGFRSRPYRDAVGVWTVGFGSTRGVGPGTPPVTREQALTRLRREVDETYGRAVNDLGVRLTQNQFDALVSFVYNVGVGGVAATTGVGRALRRGDMRAAADEMLRWTRAGGRVLEGLVLRRRAERELFLARERANLARMTVNERRWCRELDRLRAAGRSPGRQRELERELVLARKRIWRAAQGPGGWRRAYRAQRYSALQARTT